MVRLRHERTGVIVNVSEAVAARLAGYKPADVPQPQAARKRTPKGAKNND